MYRDIALINIFGLRGTLYIDTQPGAQGVRVHSTGRYEDKKVPGNQLLVFPKGQEPQPLSPEEQARAAGRSSIVQVRFGLEDRPRAVRQHRRPPKQLRSRAIIRITCPPGVEVKLFDCWGAWKVGRSWRMMRGDHRHVTG
jgi:hypothetical protein